MDYNTYWVDDLTIKRKKYWLDYIFYSQYVVMIDDKKMGRLKPGRSLTVKVKHKERHTIWIEQQYWSNVNVKIQGNKSKRFDIKDTSTNNATLEIQHSRAFILINTLIMLSSLPLLGFFLFFLFYSFTFLLLVTYFLYLTVLAIYIEFTRREVKSKNIIIKEVSE